jgi:hypothetical protein
MTDTLKSETVSFGQQEYPMDASNFKFAIPCYLSLYAKHEFLKWHYEYLAACAQAEHDMYVRLIETLNNNLPVLG